MRFFRKFTTPSKSPYDGVHFVEREAGVVNADGSQAGKTYRVIAPESWSLTAVKILATKYMRRAGVPSTTQAIKEEGLPVFLWPSRMLPASEGGSDKVGGEKDARAVFDRLAGCWAYWGWKQGHFGIPDGTVERFNEMAENARVFHDEIRFMLVHQMAAPASPQWFNTGLSWAYGIHGEDSGQWCFNAAVEAGNTFPFAPERLRQSQTRPQANACFIQGVEDSLVEEGGIMDLWKSEACVFKFGGGSGTNFSELRAEGEPLSGGGTSSGVLSFLSIGDRAAGAIKSGGTTRRAAKMAILDDDHPDIEEFIDLKAREEQKVAALVAGSTLILKGVRAIFKAATESGFVGASSGEDIPEAVAKACVEAKLLGLPPQTILRAVEQAREGDHSWRLEEMTTEWNDDAYRTVTGQNANNTVRLSDELMEAAGEDGPWKLYDRTEKRRAVRDGDSPEPRKVISARGLLRRIAKAAWASADPGVHYGTTINEWNTCAADGPIRASNPCSEYLFLDNTGCNLASVNLVKFLTPGLKPFDVRSFKHAVHLWTVVLDITVGMAGYPTKAIAEGSSNYRTLGLGYANAGGLLMRLGLPYDSEAGRGWIASVTAIMHFQALLTSAEMAGEIGTFTRYEANKAHCLRVVGNHVAAAHQDEFVGLTRTPKRLTEYLVEDYMADAAQFLGCLAHSKVKTHGLRNAQVTLLAPTGTIGLLMDVDATGIEPDFAMVKFKRLAGGGDLKIVNQSVPFALRKLGYTEDAIAKMERYAIGTYDLAGAPHGFRDKLASQGYTAERLAALQASLGGLFHIGFAVPKEHFEAMSLGASEIADINQFLCGTMTMEGAPGLFAAHLPVFDCASKCGMIGKRYLSPVSHLAAMGAAQPYISGAISKTVNMPAHSTIADVEEVYESGWGFMLKAIAIYREGSKLSQPLSTSSGLSSILSDPVAKAGAAMAERIVVRYSSERRRLPARRPGGYTLKTKIDGQKIYLRTGEYQDGTLGEIFLDLSKGGASLRSWANCLSIAVSLGLQHGVPLDEFVDAFVGVRFAPSGFVQDHDSIKMATSIIDMVFKELAINYLGRSDFGSSHDEEDDGLDFTKAEKVTSSMTASAVGRLKGYGGESCPECGMFTLLTVGSCSRCDSCGVTSGCSG